MPQSAPSCDVIVPSRVLAVGAVYLICAVLCVGNPGLLPYVLTGLGLAAAYTFWRVARTIGIVAVSLLFVAFIVWATIALFSVCIGCGSQQPNYWDVTISAQATYDPGSETWTVTETFTVPSRDALQRIVTDIDASLDRKVASMPSRVLAERLRRSVATDGWSLLAYRNGLPVFQREDATVPADVERLPFHTTLDLHLPDVPVVQGRVYLIPGEGSQLIVSTPSDMLSTTDPPGVRSEVADGDRWVIPLHGETFESPGARLEAVSPLVRKPPLRTVADISYAGAAGWILMALVGFVTSAFKSQLKSFVDPKVETLLVKPKLKKKKSSDEGPVGSAGETAEPAEPAQAANTETRDLAGERDIAADENHGHTL